jgi:hypothetical protein
VQPNAWCWYAGTGGKWHKGVSVSGFAPEIGASELPVELRVLLDCGAGTFSIARGG